MIHYHGTPLGGEASQKGLFLTGRHALVPYTYQTDMAVVSEFSQSFVLDNGAYTIWKQGGKLDIHGYIEWVEKWAKHPGFDWALIPDVIDGTDQQNDSMISAWPQDLPGVPVYHLHEDTKRLRHFADNYKVVALGSSGLYASPGTFGWWGRMKKIMEAVCDEDGRPRCKLHGLRMLDPQIFTKLPLSSADSTNAAVNSGSLSRFGQYTPSTVVQRANIIAARIESYNSAPVWSGVQQEEFNLVHSIPESQS